MVSKKKTIERLENEIEQTVQKELKSDNHKNLETFKSILTLYTDFLGVNCQFGQKFTKATQLSKIKKKIIIAHHYGQ